MLFFGEQINVGDRVFHIRYGYITVSEVHDAHFIASGGGKRHHVSSDGVTMGAQLIFWHNPWIAVPPKSLATWDKVVAIANAAHNVLK